MMEKSYLEEIGLLIKGKDAFRRIRKLISEAQEEIEIHMFIWRDDQIGNALAKDLLEAANRGVKICIIKDRKGGIFEFAEETRQSFFHKQEKGLLTIQGYILSYLYPMSGKAVTQRQIDNTLVNKLCTHPNIQIERNQIRNDHSKYYIIDHKELVLGGINVEDKEVEKDTSGRPYHDYMVHLTGKAYVETFRQHMSGEVSYNPNEPITYLVNHVGEVPKRLEAKRHVMSLLEQAKGNVLIMMAYLGDEDVSNQLIALSSRGIVVQIIIPTQANLQQDYNIKVVKKLYKKSQGHIKIYRSPYMIHAKLILIDQSIVTVGSLNLNKQAMKYLSELNIVVRLEENDFKKKLLENIRHQLAISKEMEGLEAFNYRPIRAWLEGFMC